MHHISFFLTAVLALGAAPLAAQKAVVFDAHSLNWEDRCTAESLQGLANRSGPRLYLDQGEKMDRQWLRVYTERCGLAFEPVSGLPDLVRRFRGAVRGFVVYDPAVDGSRYVAVTLAGVEKLLPVAPEVMKKLGDIRLPVRRDLRGQFQNSVAAYEWALREVMPRCSRKLAHSVDGGLVDGFLAGVCGPMSGFDWQTQNKGFVFNLGSQPVKMNSYGAQVGGSPEQAEMYRRILEALEPPAQINGYGDPEDYWCALLTRHNHYSFHAYTNWSFHHKVPARKKTLQQKVTYTPAATKPETDRYYVCFMTSEGDTMKGPLPFFYGSWFDADRGKVPVNWGINPQMAKLFPAMLEYYYDTASPVDYFFSGCSGAGYCYPDVMPDLDRFLKETGRACRSAGIGHIDMWGASRPETLERYARIARPLGLTSFMGPARLKLLGDGTPVAFHELGYWQTHELEGGPWGTLFADESARRKAVRHLVDRIERIAARVRPPFVILVYGDLHNYARHASLYREVAEALDPRRFRPARLDEAMAGIRAWSRDRVMMGTESLNEPPVGAYLTGAATEIPITLTNGRSRETAVQIKVAAGNGTRPISIVLKPHEIRQVIAMAVPPRTGDIGKVTLTLEAAGKRETAEMEPAPVPGGEAYRSAVFAGGWSADTLIHPSGKAVNLPDAAGGRAWSSPEAGGKPDCVSCGPYAARPAGRYVAAFRIRLAPEVRDQTLSSDAVILTLDMSAGGYAGGGKLAAARDIRMSDLGAPGEWRWLLLEGRWDGSPGLMETRVHWRGSARVIVDRVALFAVK